jgi:hypothetical protein
MAAGCGLGAPDANDESLWILHFAAGLAGCVRVQEEAPVPRSRLACIHLQSLGLSLTVSNRASTCVPPT